jgi:hypothetical protein
VACRKIIGTLLGIFTAGLVVPSPARIAESVAAVARDVFADREQECEACHGARAELYERRAHIRHATRHLLKLVQPQLALEGDEPLSETVAAVLPNIADLVRSGPGSRFMPACTERFPHVCVRACTRPCAHKYFTCARNNQQHKNQPMVAFCLCCQWRDRCTRCVFVLHRELEEEEAARRKAEEEARRRQV